MLSTLMINHLSFNAIFFLIDYLIIHNDVILYFYLVFIIRKYGGSNCKALNLINAGE